MIEALNKHIALELSAHMRYSGQAQLLRYHGWNKLADKYEEEASEELSHANILIRRVQQLGGTPMYMGPVSGEAMKKCDVRAMLTSDLAVEEKVLESLTPMNQMAEGEETDYETSNILRELIHGTEDHITWISQQLELIEYLGLANYLQAQL